MTSILPRRLWSPAKILPVLPLRGTVVLPLTMVPLAAGQPRSLRLIDSVASGDRRIVLVKQHDDDQTDAGPDDVRTIGTLATIRQLMRIPDGTVRLAIQGQSRVKVTDWVTEEPFLTARVEPFPEDSDAEDVETTSSRALDAGAVPTTRKPGVEPA